MKNLKKIIILFSSVLFIISCTTDEESMADTNADAKNLIGTWLLSEITQDGKVETEIQGVPVSGTITSFGKDIDAQVTFTENPDNYTTSGSYTDVITIKALGQTFNEEQLISINNILGNGSWTLNQGILTLTHSNDIQAAKIIELTSVTLKLEIEIEQLAALQGINGTIKSTLEMTLMKQ